MLSLKSLYATVKPPTTPHFFKKPFLCTCLFVLCLFSDCKTVTESLDNRTYLATIPIEVGNSWSYSVDSDHWFDGRHYEMLATEEWTVLEVDLSAKTAVFEMVLNGIETGIFSGDTLGVDTLINVQHQVLVNWNEDTFSFEVIRRNPGSGFSPLGFLFDRSYEIPTSVITTDTMTIENNQSGFGRYNEWSVSVLPEVGITAISRSYGSEYVGVRKVQHRLLNSKAFIKVKKSSGRKNGTYLLYSYNSDNGLE